MRFYKFGQALSITFALYLVYPYFYISSFPEQVAQAQTTQDLKVKADQIFTLGNQQLDKNQYREALISYQSSLEIYRKINDPNSQAKALANIGFSHDSLKQYEKAIDYYKQALELKKEARDNKSQILLLNNIGFSYNSLKQYEKAIDYFQQALVMALLGLRGLMYNELLI